MSTIIVSDAGTFGPFLSIQQLEDRLRADGVDYQFDVIGNYSITHPSPVVVDEELQPIPDPEAPPVEAAE